MRGKYVVKTKPFLLSVALVLLILEDVVGHFVSVMHYYDEILAIAFLLYYLAAVLSRKSVKKTDAAMIVIVISLLVMGFAGNAASKVQRNVVWQAFDAFNIFKFAVVLLGGQLFFENNRNKRYLIEYTANAVKAVVSIATFFMVVNLLADIGMHTDYRHGIRAYNFVFSRVGDFYSSCILWIIVLTASLFFKNRKSTRLYIGLTLINMCASMRSRAWGFALLYVFVLYAFVVRKERTFRWWYLVTFAAMMYSMAADRFNFYYSGNRARNVLLKYGLVTARNYFPLGSGLATYGTAIAQKHYSILYRQYNFSAYWGLSAEYRAFLTDNFWPAVMAEFGFIGTALMSALLILFIVKVVKMADNPYSKVCVYFGLGTLLLSSLVASSFFACTPLVVMLCISCRLCEDSRTGSENGKLWELRKDAECEYNGELFRYKP